ncbi:hypothetical protein ACX9NE_17275 [Mycobacterium sp. ML4]
MKEQTNGSLSGEWIEDSIGCHVKRTATFTLTGDVKMADLTDPAKLTSRTPSQALHLHSIYHSRVTLTGNSTAPPEEANYSVDTICLRDGDGGLSRFLQTDRSGREQLFVFENGARTEAPGEDTPCPGGGTSHTWLTTVVSHARPGRGPFSAAYGAAGCQRRQVPHVRAVIVTRCSPVPAMIRSRIDGRCARFASSCINFGTEARMHNHTDPSDEREITS